MLQDGQFERSGENIGDAVPKGGKDEAKEWETSFEDANDGDDAKDLNGAACWYSLVQAEERHKMSRHILSLFHPCV